MITKYSLENFKSFSSKEEFNLANLTLVYGQNSSGKSSIIQSLLLLKQTLLGRDPNAGLITSGSYVSLPDHKTLIHQHRDELDIDFSIEFKIDLQSPNYNKLLNQTPPFGIQDIRGLSVSYSYHNDSKGNVSYLKKMDYFASQKNSKKYLLNFSITNGKSKKFSTNSESFFRIINTEENNFLSYVKKREKIESDSETVELYGIFDEEMYMSNSINLPTRSSNIQVGEKINDQLTKVNKEIEFKLSTINYLGPLRSYPKRFYSTRGGERSLTEKDFVNVFNHDKKNIVDKINYWFKRFEIPYALTVEDVGNSVTGKIISIQLRDERNGTIVTPADVGFGIGQVLPIIIEAVVNKNSIICVEQPEIHLHPRLQAHLADLFIESVSDDNGNQWIIETHSEALILRIQRRIRSQSIDKSLVRVVYVQAGDNGSSIQDLPLDETGRFLVHWPEGFFEERLNEQFGE